MSGLPKLEAFIAKTDELLGKFQLGVAITLPLIKDAKEKFAPVLDEIKKTGLFKRGKRIAKIEASDAEQQELLLAQIAINEAQQVQIDALQELVAELTEQVKELLPKE